MDEDGDDDECDAQPEGEAHFLQFTKQDGGKDNAVNGFQIIGQVYSKGRYGTQGPQLEQEGQNGENGT